MYIIEIENNGVTELLHEMDPKSLRRVSDCDFTDSTDEVDTATIEVPLQNPAYANLHEKTTLIRIINIQTKEVEFDGYVFHIPEEDMESSGIVSKKITCESVLGYLCDSVQLCHQYETTEVMSFLASLLDYHNKEMEWYNPERRMWLGECTVSNMGDKSTAYRSTMEEIKQNLISKLGGVLYTKRNQDNQIVLNYYKDEDFGQKCNTRVEIAVNMKSISTGTDATGVITRLYPLGCQTNTETGERLTITSVNDGWASIDDKDAIEKYGVICGTYTWDDITEPDKLLEAGKEYLKQACQIKKSYQAVVLDLSVIGKAAEGFRAGNIYRFFNPLIGLDEDLKIIRRTVNIFRPYQPTVEIGDKMEKITDIATQTRNYIEYEIPKQRSEILQQARNNTTALLNNATKGYIYIDNEAGELLIMDTPDKATATKVWCWNSSGFAYSNQGYGQEYFVGMTKDGGIVADRITSGTITGIEFNNGDGTFKVTDKGEVTAKAINITGGKINISTDNENYDAIVLNYVHSSGNKMAEYTPLGLHVTNYETSFRVQNHGIFGQKNGVTTISLNSDTGGIVCGNITSSGDISCNKLNVGDQIWCSNKIVGWNSIQSENLLCATGYGDGSYFNVGDTLIAINNNINTLWNAVFG